ncbi:MAG: hypothetical protein U5K29_04755 [Acidimicrobiales bacterium]|nr:hypothetical protein [Acidimicrobiales bacterium]
MPTEPDPDGSETPDGAADPREAVPSRDAAALAEAWQEVVDGPIGHPENIDAHFELLPRSLPYSQMRMGPLVDDRISIGTSTGSTWEGVCVADTWLIHRPWDNEAEEPYTYEGALAWFEAAATDGGWEFTSEANDDHYGADATRYVLVGHGQEWIADVVDENGMSGPPVHYCPAPQ